MIGNSSSGIIEAPSFGVPTVNIGSRQLGRLAANSVLHCAPDAESIYQAIATAVSAEFAATCRTVSNPYGQGNASEQIVRIIENHSGPFHKHFHDLELRP